MAWSSSMFRAWTASVLGQGQTAAVLPAGYAGIPADTINVALYNNTGTPDKDATLITTGYNSATSQWVVANEVTGSGIWAAAGRPLAGKTITNPATGVTMFDATDLAGAGTGTLANVFGCLVYDDTITVGIGGIADQGICFNSFGGSQSVTSGTFTIVWNANGIARITSS